MSYMEWAKKLGESIEESKNKRRRKAVGSLFKDAQAIHRLPKPESKTHEIFEVCIGTIQVLARQELGQQIDQGTAESCFEDLVKKLGVRKAVAELTAYGKEQIEPQELRDIKIPKPYTFTQEVKDDFAKRGINLVE